MPPPFPSPVSLAVWPWRQPPAPPSEHAARPGALFAQALAGYLLAGLAVWLLRRWGVAHWKTVAWVAASFTTLVLAMGFAAPAVHQKILAGLLRLVFWVGSALTAILLPAIYFLVFLPLALLRRLGRSDSLDRSFPGPAGSLWKPRKPVASPDEYTRQI